MATLTLFTLLCSLVLALAMPARSVVRTGSLQRGDQCTNTPDQCAAGLSCDGKGDEKRCIKYKAPGMRCPAHEKFWICEPGLTCDENNVCKIPRGGTCTESPDQCVEGLSCDGKGNEKRCITYKEPGMRCPPQEKFWICKPDLTCDENDVCKIPQSGVCTNFPDQCAADLSCDGKGNRKRCITYQAPGRRCPRHRKFTICQPGLTCKRGVCKIPQAGVCTEFRNQCVTGLSCDGKGDEKRCIAYNGPGKSCPADEEFWICKPDLTCDENNVCKIPRGGTCTDSPDQCAEGLSCDGKGDRKRCITYKAPGMPCPPHENFWICQPGLTCDENNLCKIPLDGSCGAAPAQCVDGAQCVQHGDGNICKPIPRNVGESCDTTFACGGGLACDGGVCKLAENARCEGSPQSCVSGTSCIGFISRKRCVSLQGPNMVCEQVGFRRCAEELTCHQGRCMLGTVPLDGSCKGRSNVCVAGLVCAGPQRNRVCKKPMQNGEFCKGDPYWKCAAGLRCVDKHCREV